MQGDLVLLSSTPGHGSIFRVTLPVPMIRGLGDISKYKNAMVLIASSSALLQDAASRFLVRIFHSLHTHHTLLIMIGSALTRVQSADFE